MCICNQDGFQVQYTTTDKDIGQLLPFLLIFSTQQKAYELRTQQNQIPIHHFHCQRVRCDG